MRRAPVRILIVVGAVAVLAVTALGIALTLAPVQPDRREGLLLVLLGAMLLVARLAPMPLAQNHKLLVSTAPLFAATLLAPAPLVMAVAAAAVLAAERIRRQPWLQTAYNAEVTLLQVAVGSGMYALTVHGDPFSALTPGRLLGAAALTAIAMCAVNTGLIELVVAVQRRALVVADVWRRRRRDLASEGALYALGLLVATATVVHTWAVALLAVPAFVIYRSLRASLVLQERLTHQAFHDPLTDLPNRAHFAGRLAEAVARAARTGRAVAVLYLDLDGFKAINDTLGHSVGDSFLCVIAARLRDSVEPGGTVARFGGDEFTVLLTDCGPADAIRTAERLLAAIRTPVVCDGQQLRVEGSIGIVHSLGGRDSIEELLRNADIAMYRAKADGKGRWAVFAPEMHAAVQERVTLERELRRAVAAGELRLHYQPTVDLGTGQVAGVEALVRWQHPVHGLVPPGRFIPLAEETGLIVPIGRWVLWEACRQARRWQQVAPTGRPFHVNVNLSPPQLRDPGFVDEVAAALAETGIPRGALVLEVTESVMVQDADAALHTLEALKALGAQLALDDFGTGYSSLSYLHQFPFDLLKVDRAFVKGIGGDARDAALVGTIIQMGQRLGLRTVAEGIESGTQAEALRRLGCDDGQGYYFARPMPASALDPLLLAGRLGAAEPGNIATPRDRVHATA